MIVVVGGIKGGSGKTTIATNLAVLRAHAGKKLLLVDADEQRSSSVFANQRDVQDIQPKWSTIQLAGQSLHSQIGRLKADYDDIIIDVGGRDTTSQRSALICADIYLVPFKPRSYDVWTLADVKTLIREMRLANSKLKAYAFINQADPKGNDNEDAFTILKECEELQCINLSVGNRKTFGNSSSDGLGIIEVKNPDKKAVHEIQELYNYVYNKCTYVQQLYRNCTYDS
jgi:chromosome partitioning protein